ncbi:MAG: amidohydrolase family protein [bacterium]|nr:amidohydrolase family protein [bacterium]
MLIDAHNHPNWWGHDARKMLNDMDEQGIEQMWLLSWECPETDYSPKLNDHLPQGGGGIPLRDVLEVGREAPDRFVLGYMPHPKRPDAIDRLKAAVEIHGVRLAGELKARVPFDDPDAIRLYQVCGEMGLPITLHLEYPIDGAQKYPRPNYWYGGSMDALERAIQACPETVFIGHAKGFWAHISGDDQADRVPSPKGPVLPGGRVAEMLKQYDNLYADLSASGLKGLERDPAYSRNFLVEFQEKLLWGRDHFHTQLIDFLLTLDLPQETFQKITCANAQKLVGEI